MSKHEKHTAHEEKKTEEQAASGSQATNGSQSSKEKQHEDHVNGENAAENNSEAASTEAESAEDKIARLEEEAANLKDQYLRKAADFENFRKRMNQEKASAIDFANQSLLLDIIPVIDDFERAIKSADSSEDFKSFHEGVTMIEKRLVSTLENKWGLKRYDSANQPFNPEIHEAIMMDKSADVSEPTVAEDFQKGYMLKDRVVRSAKVKVLMPENEKADEAADSE